MPLLRRAHLSHIRGGCVLSDLLPTARTGHYRDRHWRRSPSRRTTCNLDNACASAPRWTLWVRSSSSKRTRPDLVLGVSRIPGGHTAGRSMRFSSRGDYDARPSAGHRPRARPERKAAAAGLVASAAVLTTAALTSGPRSRTSQLPVVATDSLCRRGMQPCRRGSSCQR
jgi:hypothetical protein